MKYSFGVDVGGTTVKIGLFCDDCLIGKREIPTRTENGGAAILPDIAGAIDDLLLQSNVAKSEYAALESVYPDRSMRRVW